MFRENSKSSEYACAPKKNQLEEEKKGQEKEKRREKEAKFAPVGVLGRPCMGHGDPLHLSLPWNIQMFHNFLARLSKLSFMKFRTDGAHGTANDQLASLAPSFATRP